VRVLHVGSVLLLFLRIAPQLLALLLVPSAAAALMQLHAFPPLLLLVVVVVVLLLQPWLQLETPLHHLV
jgi:hypothetical protein